MGRFGNAGDLDGALLLMVSDAGAYMTGATVVVDGGQVVAVGALRGLTDVKVPTAITLIAYWGLAIPGGYFFGIRGEWGARGIWSALAAGLAFAAILLTWRFRWLTAASR